MEKNKQVRCPRCGRLQFVDIHSQDAHIEISCHCKAMLVVDIQKGDVTIHAETSQRERDSKNDK